MKIKVKMGQTQLTMRDHTTYPLAFVDISVLYYRQENCPAAELEKIRTDSGCCTDVDSDAFAKYMDTSDPLKGFRDKFQYPKKRELPIGQRERRPRIFLMFKKFQDLFFF